MAFIDLKDAFYSVPIHKTTKPTWHYFRRIFEICMYAKWIWTSHVNIYKNFKKIFFILREKGFLSVIYVDDWYLQGDNYEDCFSNFLNTKEILRSLGFTIHPEKSKFIPTQCITYLGFILNSVQIAITLEKKEKILNLCQEILQEDEVTIRFLSKLIGNLVATFLAVTLGPFYYRALEMDKAKALQQSALQLDYPMKRRKNCAGG